MCRDCGCDASHASTFSENDSAGRAIGREPGEKSPGFFEDTQAIEINRRVLGRLDALAAANRKWLSDRSIVAVNLISSPGSGKTTLLDCTLERLGERFGPSVIVGDQRTSLDAERLAKRCSRVLQIETTHSCHLDPSQIRQALPRVVAPETRLLIIENVGNLVCPSAFDLGERCKIALLSTTEGEDKPLKYPALFMESPVVLITKTDLLPHLEWDMKQCRRNIRRMRPDARIIEVSARSGDGISDWIEYLEELIE